MSGQTHATDDSTDLEPTSDDGYTVHHIDADAAERAVERFERKAAAADAGEDVGLSDRLFIEDELLAETADESTFLIDGEPLGSWLAGTSVDRRRIDTDADSDDSE
jgi:hypothetical protein